MNPRHNESVFTFRAVLETNEPVSHERLARWLTSIEDAVRNPQIAGPGARVGVQAVSHGSLELCLAVVAIVLAVPSFLVALKELAGDDKETPNGFALATAKLMKHDAIPRVCLIPVFGPEIVIAQVDVPYLDRLRHDEEELPLPQTPADQQLNILHRPVRGTFDIIKNDRGVRNLLFRPSQDEVLLGAPEILNVPAGSSLDELIHELIRQNFEVTAKFEALGERTLSSGERASVVSPVSINVGATEPFIGVVRANEMQPNDIVIGNELKENCAYYLPQYRRSKVAGAGTQYRIMAVERDGRYFIESIQPLPIT